MVERIKPSAPLSQQIEEANNKLDEPIAHLQSINEKLHVRDEQLYRMVVDAQRTNSNNYAYIYANELNQVRHLKRMVKSAMLSIEQVQMRLKTVSDLGDIVVTMSPCMATIRELGPAIAGMAPAAANSMNDLAETMQLIMSQSSTNAADMAVTGPQSTDAEKILDEVHSEIIKQAQGRIPEVPSELETQQFAVEDVPSRDVTAREYASA